MARRRRSPKRESRQIRTEPVKATLRGDPTCRLDDCYARPVGCCSTSLSAEHFLSEVLLQKLCQDDRGIYLRGFSWTPDGKWVRPETVKSRILCTNHNSGLAPLDAFIGLFDDELRRISGTTSVSTTIQFNGNNFERWMLKALCGLLASGSARKSDATELFGDIPASWIHVLFGRADLAPPLGLYVSGTIGEQWDISDSSIGMAPVSIGNQVVGLTLRMQWLQCTLMMTTWNGQPASAINENSIRRPAHLRVLSGAHQHTVQFLWDGGAGPGVEITYTRGAIV